MDDDHPVDPTLCAADPTDAEFCRSRTVKADRTPGDDLICRGPARPEVFPVDRFQEACQSVLGQHGRQALQYSTTEGYRPLREMIARHTARYGIHVDPENILITSGSQQALDLIGKVFINPGDRLLVERPTYVGALQAWNAYQAEYITIALDDEGMQTDELEAALRAGPKFIYVLPNFHNPAGVTLARERRQRLVELADRYGVPLIEDDPYGQLRYEGSICRRWLFSMGSCRARGHALSRQRPVPEHVFEDVSARPASGLGGGARRGDPPAGAAKQGRICIRARSPK